MYLLKEDGKWTARADDPFARKRVKHWDPESDSIQGPIDDAFLDSFVFVLPTGQPTNEKVGRWVAGESEHAITHWRKQFRGEARVKALLRRRGSNAR